MLKTALGWGETVGPPGVRDCIESVWRLYTPETADAVRSYQEGRRDTEEVNSDLLVPVHFMQRPKGG